MTNIIESLKIWLFGTVGLFIVMGVIVLVVIALNLIGKKSNKEESQEASTSD